MTDRSAPDRLAVLVHEVRSSSAALAAIATTFYGGDVDELSRAELVRLAIGACRAIERIMLDISYASIEPHEIDPGQVVRDVAAHAALEGTRVEVRVAPDLPRIAGDDVRLRQALGNLVANARVHSRSDAVVVVGASTGGGEVHLFVSDSGIGVPGDDHERILEPGMRLDPTRPGSGLGLAIVNAIAEAHGGRLRIVSAPGEGATFTIALPSH